MCEFKILVMYITVESLTCNVCDGQITKALRNKHELEQLFFNSMVLLKDKFSKSIISTDFFPTYKTQYCRKEPFHFPKIKIVGYFFKIKLISFYKSHSV